MPNDSGVGSSPKRIPRSSKKRERAEAKINAWLCQIGTDELAGFAKAISAKRSATKSALRIADEQAATITKHLTALKSPSPRITLTYSRPPKAPKFQSLSKKAREELRREVPEGASAEFVYEAIQSAIVDHLMARWITRGRPDTPLKSEDREELQLIGSLIRKLNAEIDRAPIRVLAVLGLAGGETLDHLPLGLIQGALRELRASIVFELESRKPNKVGRPTKRDDLADRFGEIILGRWEMLTGREPTRSKFPGGICRFAEKVVSVAPVRAEVALEIAFSVPKRRVLKELFPLTFTEGDILHAIEGAIRARREVKNSLPE